MKFSVSLMTSAEEGQPSFDGHSLLMTGHSHIIFLGLYSYYVRGGGKAPLMTVNMRFRVGGGGKHQNDYIIHEHSCIT